MTQLLAIVLLCVSVSARAQAFDLFPEFGGLDAIEASGFDNPLLLDSEYQSDVLAYMPSLESEAAFFSRPMSFDFHAGSLTSKQFLHYQRARLRKAISDDVEFRFTHFIQQDLEEDRVRNWLELVWRGNGKLGASLYGEVGREKEEIDTGLALLLWPRPQHEIRLFHTWVDIVREERSQSGDKFVSSHNPNSIGISGRIEGDQEHYWAYGFRRDLPGVWRFPQSSTDYSHERSTVWSERSQLIHDRLRVETRFQWDRKREARSTLIPTTPSTQSQHRDRLQALIAIAMKPEQKPYTIRPGIFFVERRYEQPGVAHGTHTNWLPHLNLELKGRERKSGHDRVAIGYEATFFGGEGSGQFFNRGSAYDSVEQRLNLRYEVALFDGAKLAFLVSADLDAGQTFEGGHGRFLVFF